MLSGKKVASLLSFRRHRDPVTSIRALVPQSGVVACQPPPTVLGWDNISAGGASLVAA